MNLKKKPNNKLTITEKAKKEMRKLPISEFKKIDTKLQKLKTDPHPKGSKKLAGSKNTYRIRQGDYRVIYIVEKKEVSIMSAGRRKDIYEK